MPDVPSVASSQYRFRFRSQNGSVVVTDRFLLIDGRKLLLTRLSDLTWRRERHPGVTAALMAGACQVTLAGVAGISGVLGYEGVVATLVGILASAAVAVFHQVRWPATMYLCGRYDGRPVALWSSRDACEFGKLARALTRALRKDDR